jgi:hypothetical protein
MSEHVTGLVRALVFGLMIFGVIGIVGGAFQMAFVIAKDTSEEERLVAKAISEIKKEK